MQWCPADMYVVTVPAVTKIRLGPGCECQPLVPPFAANVLPTTYASDRPWVLSFSRQRLAGSDCTLSFIGSNGALASVVVVWPDGGVARTVPAKTPTTARMPRSANSHFDFISPPLLVRTRALRRRGSDRARPVLPQGARPGSVVHRRRRSRSRPLERDSSGRS